MCFARNTTNKYLKVNWVGKTEFKIIYGVAGGNKARKVISSLGPSWTGVWLLQRNKWMMLFTLFHIPEMPNQHTRKTLKYKIK
jgi:lipocalin